MIVDCCVSGGELTLHADLGSVYVRRAVLSLIVDCCVSGGGLTLYADLGSVYVRRA